MLIADRLLVPDGTSAVLWDMDGVLLDTLSMDYELVSRLLSTHAVPGVQVPRKVIRAYFPYDIPDFWRLVLGEIGVELPRATVEKLANEHMKAREHTEATVNDGIVEILTDARRRGIQAAVVSNNPEADVARMLSIAGLGGFFQVIVGNDDLGMKKKPAPDSYLAAIDRLGGPAQCAAVEDSLLGAEAAKAAGCWTIGVATGASDFETLSSAEYIDRCYTGFAPCRVTLGGAGVTAKSLRTPNDFVSHMIEHIAWRLGCSVDVAWTNDGWFELGHELGRRVADLPRAGSSAGVLGMIDDGSCELALRRDAAGGARFRAAGDVDLGWFLALRCEQLSSGQPLVALLNGLGAGCAVAFDILVASAEDPHHTWEGIFRGVGTGLSKITGTPERAAPHPPPLGRSHQSPDPPPRRETAVERGWTVMSASATGAKLRRETAESVVQVDLGLGSPSAACTLAVADSINVTGITGLLREFALAADMHLTVDFDATRLSSSHVVTEDIGLTLGRAMRCVAIERMMAFGINGAGSSIGSADDLSREPVRVGVSMEGRKFCKFVPFNGDYADFRKSFLIGHTLPGGLYTEDLDDFIDGFAGGLQASVMVHVGSPLEPTTGWPLVFRSLGAALREFLAHNPSRRALAPGVKATLA